MLTTLVSFCKPDGNRDGAFTGLVSASSMFAMGNMKSLAQIRRDNLRRVIKDYFNDSVVEFTDKAGYSTPVLVYRLLSPTKPKGIGDKLARKVEGMANKPKHWLDHDHNEAVGPIGTRDEPAAYRVVSAKYSTREQVEIRQALQQIEIDARAGARQALRVARVVNLFYEK